MISRFQEYYAHLRNLNAGLILCLSVISLTFLGLVVLASASQSFSQESISIFDKQLVRLGISLFAGIFTLFINLENIRKYIWILLVFAIFLLFLVLIPGIGISVNGARRWLDLGFFRFQVSDFAKLALIFTLAHYLAENQRYIKTFKRGFLIPSSIIGFISLLILVEPDFGTAFLCGLLGFSILFLAGVKLRYLIPSLTGSFLFFTIAVILNPVRLRRLTSFLDVEANKSDGAYQLWQGILAFAAGGIEGVGLGQGRQQMDFLPEAHTDFIFPIIGEELGLFFTIGVVALFFIIFIVGFIILKQMPNLYYFCLALGSLLCIIFQAIINIGVVTGLVPTKGMALPFISYGGSNLILMFILVGLLLNCLITASSTPIVRAKEI